MATKKNDSTPAPTTESVAYEAAVGDYGAAIEMLRKGDYAAARDAFLKIRAGNPNEPELAERAGTYARVCETKMADPESQPVTLDDQYHRAVLLSNRGRWDEAIQLATQALAQEPTSVNCLYVRASAWALKGSADKAVSDLREAIAIDPKVRFQAINDADFESIREEPSFIDIIEPTPTGA